MNERLQQHPLWALMDHSSRQLLAISAQPVLWHNASELQQLAHDNAILGWFNDGRVLTLLDIKQLSDTDSVAGFFVNEPGKGWRIPNNTLQTMLQDQEACTALAQQSQISLTGSFSPSSALTAAPLQIPPGLSMRSAVGWCMALGLPAIAMMMLAGRTDSVAQWLCFFSALGAGLCVWVMGLAPPLIGALLALLLMMVGNHLPVQQALGGFTSGSFFLLLGMFGCSAAVQRSGLMQRMLGAILRPLPHTSKVFQACLLLLGTLMTLFIPSTSGRLQLIAPMAKALAQPANRPALAFAALSGCTLFSTSFLLGNSANFIVLGILPEHWQAHANWLSWFQCAAVYTLALAICLVCSIAFGASGPKESAANWKSVSTTGFSSTQWITLLALAILALGASLVNVHHIEMTWLALFVLLLLMATDAFPIRRLQSDIPWSILLYLVCTVGIARGFTHMGIQDWLMSHVTVLEQLMNDQQMIFLLLLTVAVLLLRLMLPAVVCITTLCAVLIPLADTHGINPLVLGFVIVTASEIWFLPHQSSDYLLFRESMALNDGEARAVLRRNTAIQCCRILALLVSIPYWQHLGFLQ